MLLVLVLRLFDKINVNRKLHNIFNIITTTIYFFRVNTPSQLKTPSS